ncbi:hypothetical protein FOZ61_008442 [Perkinsus olseni]|uniref:Spindle pole body component n=1 Tax=Perkinsus olseni TaxID=32597 RepID=A0A7J6MXS4_PEROL|nr:hypothetical protein FOZ61_008442 [Perkinsus olseni]KAF4675701.1 hypothetical protein FOL46_000469 [Perkinsus olseni]
MLGSTSVSAFGRERQSKAESVLADLVDAFIPPDLDLGYADRSKITQFSRYHLAFHSFPSVDTLAVDRDMKEVIYKVNTRATPVGSAELLADLYVRDMPKTAVAAGLTDDGDESIIPSIISLLLSLSGDPCGVDRSEVDRVGLELQEERAKNAARYDHLGRLREGLEEKRILEAIAKASVETGWELAMAACDTSSDDDVDRLADNSVSTNSGRSTPPSALDLPIFDPLGLRAGAVPTVDEDPVKCADDLTRECRSSLLTVESSGRVPEDLLAADADIIGAIVAADGGRRRPFLVRESWVVEEIFTACYVLSTAPVEEGGSIVCLNTLFHISDGVVGVHAAVSRGDTVACSHLSPRALSLALVSIAGIMTDLKELSALSYLPARYDHPRCFLAVQAEVDSLVRKFTAELEAIEEAFSTSEVACSLVAITCALKRVAKPITEASVALRGDGPLAVRLWKHRAAGSKVADGISRAYTDPLLSCARTLACDGVILSDHRSGPKEMVAVLEAIAADPTHPLQVITTRTLAIHSSVTSGWAVQRYDDRARLMGFSSEAQVLLEHRLAARAAGSHAVRGLLNSGGQAPALNAIFKALRMVCMAFDEHVQEWLADPGPRGPVWASRYGAWVKSHVMDLTGVDIDIDALGGSGVRLPALTSQQSAILTPLALQFYSKVFDMMKPLYEAQSCIVAKPRCLHPGVLNYLFAVRAELLHFVRSLESYLKQSVIEPESRRFDALAANVDSAESLGHLHYHDYLHARLARSLFMSPRTAVVRDSLLAMLDVCKTFRTIAERSARLSPPGARLVRERTSDSVSSFDASADTYYPGSRDTATTDQWTADDPDGDPAHLLSELTELRRKFKASCRGLLNVLAVAAKDDRSVCHDLGMKINFAYYYLLPR